MYYEKEKSKQLAGPWDPANYLYNGDYLFLCITKSR